MKKKHLIMLIILLAFLIVFTPLFFNLTFFKDYYTIHNYNTNEDILIKIPKYSYFVREKGMFVATFKSIKNNNNINKFINNYLNTLEKSTCSNEYDTYYYDKTSDITLFNYHSKKGTILNTIYLGYSYGNYCDQLLDQEMENSLFDLNIERDKECTDELEVIYEKDNNKIYTKCLNNIKISLNHEEFDLTKALEENKINFDKLIKQMEYNSKYAEVSKKAYRDGGSILYSNFNYSLLKCYTTLGNRDIIIGDTNLKYETNYCQS